MSEGSEFKYIVAYMAGTENEGITEDWTPVESMVEAVRFIGELEMHHDFYKASICEIKESYES